MKRLATKYPLLSYLLLAYGITTLGWLPSILNGWSMGETPVPLALLGGWGPSLAGILMTVLLGGAKGLRTLGARLRQRAPIGWYGLVLLGWAGFYFIGTGLHAVLGKHVDFAKLPVFEIFPQAAGQSLWLLAPLVFLFMFLTGGAMNEEFGWRGFLLPQLLERFNPAMAALLLAPLWWAWHLPQHLLPGSSADLLQFLIQLSCTSVIFTWIFLRTKGNLLLSILLHAAQNTTGNFFPPALDGIYFALQIITAALILTSWLIRVGRHSVSLNR